MSTPAAARAATPDGAAAPPQSSSPLKMRYAIAIIVGVAVGAGIFKAPSVVTANVPSASWMFALWFLGGLLTMAGALCYAELASTYPNAGGEYHFLSRAFGRNTALVYAWSRFSVISTGSIALLGFVFGDYVSRLLPLGPHGQALYAAAAVLVLSVINVRGIRSGAQAQSWLTALEVLGLVLIVCAGLWLWWQGAGVAATPLAAQVELPGGAPLSMQGIGLAMVFVLLTFGGWNDAACISTDLKTRRSIVWALLLSVGLITALYLLVNWAYWHALGLAGMARSEAVAADVLAVAFGPAAGRVVSALIAVAALASINATLITGARTASALGQDWPQQRALAALAAWDTGRGVPRNAFIAQGTIALLLIALGATFQSGFQAMVEYTAPVFWLFFLLTGASLFRLRRLDPALERPFRVPLYPLLPALFCLSSTYMLWASLSFVHSQRLGGFNAAWVGVAVMASGLVLPWLLRRAEVAR